MIIIFNYWWKILTYYNDFIVNFYDQNITLTAEKLEEIKLLYIEAMQIKQPELYINNKIKELIIYFKNILENNFNDLTDANQIYNSEIQFFSDDQILEFF